MGYNVSTNEIEGEIVTTAVFEISELLTSNSILVKVKLNKPLKYRGSLDSEFQTFQCQAMNARTLKKTIARRAETI